VHISNWSLVYAALVVTEDSVGAVLSDFPNLYLLKVQDPFIKYSPADRFSYDDQLNGSMLLTCHYSEGRQISVYICNEFSSLPKSEAPKFAFLSRNPPISWAEEIACIM
jgi:hypothetical protein